MVQIIRGILVDVVVQPVGVQQVAVGAPAEQRVAGGVVGGVVVAGHVDGLARLDVPLVLGVQGVLVVLGVADDEEINDTRTDLTAAQSEYDYLSTKMSDITSRASLQDVAEGQLGLVKADQSQITYIQLEEQSVIEKTGSDAGRVLVGIRTAALNLLDSFNP